MKYKYEPNCHIVDYEAGRTKFIFDAEGNFETEDPKLIDWIKKNKNFLKPIPEEIQPELATPPETDKEIKVMHCKKCDFTTDNNGAMMAHYRKEHPKNKE